MKKKQQQHIREKKQQQQQANKHTITCTHNQHQTLLFQSTPLCSSFMDDLDLTVPILSSENTTELVSDVVVVILFCSNRGNGVANVVNIVGDAVSSDSVCVSLFVFVL